MSRDRIENKDGLYGLLGIPETSVLIAGPGDTIIIKVDVGSSQDEMWAHGNRVREILPECRILVLPRNVDISYFPEDYAHPSMGMATVR